MYTVIEYLFAVNTQRTFLLMYVAHQPSVMRKNMYAHMCGVVISMCVLIMFQPQENSHEISVCMVRLWLVVWLPMTES